MFKTMKLMLVFIVLLMITACGGYHNPGKTSIERDVEAKKFAPTPGKSKIYIVRPSKFGGKAIYLNPTVDKMVVGNLLSGSYLMLEVLPGKHEISAAGDLDDPKNVEIITEADQLYFVKMYPKFGAVSPRLHNEIIDQKEGANLVNKHIRYKTIEYKIPPQILSSSTGKTTLYIVRPSMFYGALMKLSPTVDNMVAGTLESGSYLVTKISPGTHRISATGKYEGKYTFELVTTAGQDYFVKISPKMGFALPKLNIERISPEEGKSLVGDYKQIQKQ